MSELAKRDDKSLSERLGEAAGVKKALFESTAPLKLQRRRTEIEGCRIRVENLLSRFKNRKLTPKQRQEMYLECQLMASFGMLKGISLLTDMLSHQDEALIINKKTGVRKRGVRRVAYLEYAWDLLEEIKDCMDIKFSPEDIQLLAEASGSEEGIPKSLNIIQAIVGLDRKLEQVKEIIHDIGIHHDPKLFEVRDSNDVVVSEDRFIDPPEFFEGDDEAEEKTEEVSDEDGEVLADDEAEEIRKRAEAEGDEEDEDLDEEDEENEEEEDETK